jgi:hypothetical protein
MSDDTISFPTYDADELTGSSTLELWQLLIRNEDRAPRNFNTHIVMRELIPKR